MIGYVCVGTNSLAEAAKFYDALFETLGARRIFELDTFIVWSTSPGDAAFALTLPYDGNPATAGNGTMVAIDMDSHEKVDAFYAKAISLGATDEGAPGDRGGNFYAGYFRDLDGNKLNACCVGGS